MGWLKIQKLPIFFNTFGFNEWLQSCVRVNHSRPFILLKSPVFWNTDTLPLATTLNIYRKDDDRYILQVWIFLSVWDCYHSLACSTSLIITFQKIYWLSGLFRSLKKLICFPFYGNDATWTQNTLISWKRLKQTGIYEQNIFFPLEIKGIWVGILSKFTIHGSCEISEDVLYLWLYQSFCLCVCLFKFDLSPYLRNLI